MLCGRAAPRSRADPVWGVALGRPIRSPCRRTGDSNFRGFGAEAPAHGPRAGAPGRTRTHAGDAAWCVVCFSVCPWPAPCRPVSDAARLPGAGFRHQRRRVRRPSQPAKGPSVSLPARATPHPRPRLAASPSIVRPARALREFQLTPRAFPLSRQAARSPAERARRSRMVGDEHDGDAEGDEGDQDDDEGGIDDDDAGGTTLAARAPSPRSPLSRQGPPSAVLPACARARARARPAPCGGHTEAEGSSASRSLLFLRFVLISFFLFLLSGRFVRSRAGVSQAGSAC